MGHPRHGTRPGSNRDYTVIMRTKKPSLRILRWLRPIQSPGPRIPFEAECSACADTQFKIKHDKRQEYGPGTFLRPGSAPDQYWDTLQRQFDEHVKLMHPEDYVQRERNAED